MKRSAIVATLALVAATTWWSQRDVSRSTSGNVTTSSTVERSSEAPTRDPLGVGSNTTSQDSRETSASMANAGDTSNAPSRSREPADDANTAKLSQNKEAPKDIDVARASLPEIRQALNRWRTCYDTECATLPHTDPRSHDFAVGEKLRGIMSELAGRAREESWIDSSIAEIARDYLTNHDGHVQAAAIDLLSTQPKSTQNLEALLEHVVGGYDAVLVEKALPELRRYLGGNEDARIHAALRHAMTTGSPFVSQIVSSKIEPFLNQESVDGYASLLPSLDPGSVVTKSLRSALTEYARRRSGG